MRRWLVLGLLAVGGILTASMPAHAGTSDDSVPDSSVPDDETGDGDGGVVSGGSAETTPVTLPVVPVPVGCDAPPLPHIVFVGTVVDRDFRTVRFEIDRVRAGDRAPFAADGRIDVRFGLDAQYLHDDEQYLVSALVDPDLGLLVSRVTEPIENFGGDEVIGVSETDVVCPDFEDPMRTLHVDGTPVEAGVLEPFFSARVRIIGALLIPFAVALGVIFALAAFRLSLSGLYRSVVGAQRRS